MVMKKFLIFLAVISSVLAVVGLFNACVKEECCRWVGDLDQTYMFCKDDVRWQDAGFASWMEVKDEAGYMKGKCK
jgi:hypothetical protein